MLSIYYGDMPEAIYNPEPFFDENYTDGWITDDFSRKVIKAIDKSEVIDAKTIYHKVWGEYSPLKLAGGTKTLIAINQRPDLIFSCIHCGNNCARWLYYIGEREDVTINLRHPLFFHRKKYTVHVLNSDELLHDDEALLFAAYHAGI